MLLELADFRSSFIFKSSSKGFYFVTKISVLICFMFDLILVSIYVVFGFKVDNFVNQYCLW